MEEKQKAIETAMAIEGLVDETELGLIYDLVIKYLKPNGAVLETGTYMGRTTSILCSATKTQSGSVTSIDLFEDFKDGEIRNEYEEHRKDVVEYNLKDHSNKTLVRGNSVDPLILEKVGGAYDLIWLDGDHRAVPVMIELEMGKYWTDAIVGHDWNDERVKGAVSRFLEYSKDFILVNAHATAQGIWEIKRNG